LPKIIKYIGVIDQPWFLKSIIFIAAFVGIGIFGLIFEARRTSVLDQKNYDGILQENPFLENLFRERKIISKYYLQGVEKVRKFFSFNYLQPYPGLLHDFLQNMASDFQK
jgi:hypothetical protein